MNKTLREYLDNGRSIDEWSKLFGIGRARTSMLRTGSVTPYAAEIESIATACGTRTVVVYAALADLIQRRLDAVRSALVGGQPTPFRPNRPGRPPRIT